MTTRTGSRPYSVDSLQRALEHHKTTGAVIDFSVPGWDRAKWIVNLPDIGSQMLTTPQVLGLCYGLRAGELAHRPMLTLAQEQAMKVDAEYHVDAYSRVAAIVDAVIKATAR